MIRRALLSSLLVAATACSSDPASTDPSADARVAVDLAVDQSVDLGASVDGAPDVPADRGVDAPSADRATGRDATSDGGAPTDLGAPVDALAPADRGAPPDVVAPVDVALDAGFDVVDVPVTVDAGFDVGPDLPRDVGRADAVIVDVGPADAGTPDAGCLAPRRLCGGVCTDTASDGAHCGACGARCAGVCSGGACAQVAQLSAGGAFTCARLTDGAARCWGDNENGEVGDGTGGAARAGRWRPTPVVGLARAVEVVAGNTHACARFADGTAQCWGRNSSGQLGDGTFGDVGTTPRAVAGLTTVAGLALGDNFTCARLTDGTVRCWGSNLSGQLGLGTMTGSVLTPTPVPGLAGVVALSAGIGHTCAVLSDGTARCWGMNFQGQCAAGAGVSRALSPVAVPGLAGAVGVALGSFFSCAWLADGTARCWGDNSGYDLGDGSGVRRDTPVAVAGLDRVAGLSAGASFACARRTDGAALCWGTDALGQMGDGTLGGAQMAPTVVPGLGAVAEVTARGDHACARLADASVRCWGSDAAGELGDDAGLNGHRTPEVVAGVRAAAQVAAGGDHTCARFADGTAQCWGSGNTGELGDGLTAKSRYAPVSVGGLTGAAALAGGSFGTCARLLDGTVRCWGYNVDGEIGDGTEGGSRATPTVALGLAGVTDLALGQTFACALSAGSVRCWGSNNSGRLGLNYADTFSHPRAGNPVMGLSGAAGVELGLFHACAFTTAGLARCWGTNDHGELGDGTLTSRSVATAVAGLDNVTAVAAGYNHTCALRGDGTVACWGANDNGQVGDGTTVTPRPAAATVPGLAGVVQLAAGDFHTCARLADGTVRCWGNNDYGQCGDDTQLIARLAPVAVRGLAGAAEVTAGASHTCARLLDGTLRCWGSDRLGQLALGALRTPRW